MRTEHNCACVPNQAPAHAGHGSASRSTQPLNRQSSRITLPDARQSICVSQWICLNSRRLRPRPIQRPLRSRTTALTGTSPSSPTCRSQQQNVHPLLQGSVSHTLFSLIHRHSIREQGPPRRKDWANSSFSFARRSRIQIRIDGPGPVRIAGCLRSCTA